MSTIVEFIKKDSRQITVITKVTDGDKFATRTGGKGTLSPPIHDINEHGDIPKNITLDPFSIPERMLRFYITNKLWQQIQQTATNENM
jgi:DNA-directed RNA polymerase beta subunit